MTALLLLKDDALFLSPRTICFWRKLFRASLIALQEAGKTSKLFSGFQRRRLFSRETQDFLILCKCALDLFLRLSS